MERAILIYGDEEPFLKAALRMRDYLKGTGIVQITLIDCKNLSFEDFKKNFSEALRKEPKAPLLLAYFGHGAPNGWGISNSEAVLYRTLVKLIKEISSPLLIVNDCCHAFSIHQEIAQHQWQAPIGLIAACAADDTTWLGLGDDVVTAWQRNKSHNPADFQRTHCVIDDLSPGYDEQIEGFRALRRHIFSAILNWFAPKHFKIAPLRLRITLAQGKRCEDKITTPHIRWGDNLDYYFFASRQLSLFPDKE